MLLDDAYEADIILAMYCKLQTTVVYDRQVLTVNRSSFTL